MGDPDQLVVFVIENQRFAIRVNAVERIVRAVDVTPVPNAPGLFHGIININGQVIPVINLRYRLGLPTKKISQSDRFIITRVSKRKLALSVDEVPEITDAGSMEAVKSEAIAKGLDVESVLRNQNGMILIYDIERLLADVDKITTDLAYNDPIQSAS